MCINEIPHFKHKINIKDSVILIEPVAIYSKADVKKLEDSVMMIIEEPDKYTEGPFSSVSDAIEYLESNDDAKAKKD